jgi:1-acyl-sn-glycerol-3-phosphate acyltransferase
VLFVSNHVSYLDISLLGSLLPGAFIAKADIEQWPLFGVLAKLQNTLFIERTSRHVKGQLDQMQQLLQQQHNLILFPEGTSSDGSAVLSFKSALFKSVEKGSPVPAWIQPVSLAYYAYNGQPMSQAIRDYYAWYNDMPAVSHMLTMAGMKRATINVILHPAVSGEQFPNRKALAEYCQQQVAAGVAQGLTDLQK